MNKIVLPPVTQYFNKYVGDGYLEYLCKQDTSAVVRFILCTNQFTYKGMVSISKGDFLNLKELLLNNNAIRGLGCKYISRTKMPSLKRLCIDNNFIGSIGMLHLCKGNWNSLIEISLVINKINRNGSSWLSKTRWGSQVQIILATNEMNVRELMLFLLYPEQSIKSVDLRMFHDIIGYHKIDAQEKKKLAAWFELKNKTTKLFI